MREVLSSDSRSFSSLDSTYELKFGHLLANILDTFCFSFSRFSFSEYLNCNNGSLDYEMNHSCESCVFVRVCRKKMKATASCANGPESESLSESIIFYSVFTKSSPKVTFNKNNQI